MYGQYLPTDAQGIAQFAKTYGYAPPLSAAQFANLDPAARAALGTAVSGQGQRETGGVAASVLNVAQAVGQTGAAAINGTGTTQSAVKPSGAAVGAVFDNTVAIGEPFQPSSPVGISDSHSVDTIGPNTRFGAGNRNTPKTIAMGGVDLQGDIDAINNGQGILQADGQILAPSGRTYGTHPDSATIYPTAGPGLVNLTQAEFQIYRQMLSSGGLQGNALRAFEGQMAAGNPGLSADSAGRLTQLFNSKGS